jgi:AAA+ ATPase superfamily predicted ATPase
MVINPFEYSKPIAYPDKFFGRQEELNRIKQSCLHLRSISIVGERRSGKTSLLKLFSIPGVIQEFGFGEDFIFCYIDAEGL